MEKTIQERRLDFLEDTVKYYSQDVSRRALDEGGRCKYKTQDNKKCAIGRFIPDDKYNSCIDSICSNGVASILKKSPECLPDEIKELGVNFLSNIQSLHDAHLHWNEKGLTEEGNKYYSEIKQGILSNNYK